MFKGKLKKICVRWGMSNDCYIIVTDAPHSALRKWLHEAAVALEGGSDNDILDLLRENYFVKVLYDSAVDEEDNELIKAIGWSWAYDIADFWPREMEGK